MPWLHKLSQMLVQGNAVQAALAAPDMDTIFSVLTDAERKLEPEHAKRRASL